MANIIKYKKLPIKKTLKYAILILVVTFFTVIIVNSYQKDHVFSYSKDLEQLIPGGDYQTYLKRKAYHQDNEEFLKNIELKMEDIIKPVLEQELKVDLTKGEKSLDAQFFKYMDIDETSVVLPDGTKVPGYYTANEGSVTFSLPEIKESGFYHIYVKYYAEKIRTDEGDILATSGGANVERKILINGVLPFETASNITFRRLWNDKEQEIRQDLNGNDMKPAQAEIFDISKEYLRDTTGYVVEPYMFYLEEGIANTITFESVRENMTIVAMTIESVRTSKSYEEYRVLHQDKKEVTDTLIKVEAEDSQKRSSPTLYAVSDRTSPKNYPSDPVRIKLNAIGGSKWNTPGDWVAWEVDVPESGMYQLSFKAKQTSSRGLFSTRKVYINGQVPFTEANAARFHYSTDWKIVTLGADNNPFLFYLEKGKNEVKLEATLGAYGGPIKEVRDVINELNGMYLKIISITTVNPDPYQEYNLYGRISELEGTLRRNSQKLKDISAEVTKLADGEKGDKNALLDRLSVQIDDFLRKPRTIQERLKQFTQNISALGTWISDVQSQSLTVEAMYVSSVDAKLPNANANFFQNTWFSIRSFVLSFFFDYESIGVTSKDKDGKHVEVWFLTSATSGREQANALKTLIDNQFSFEKNITVSLKVVSPGVLLPTTLAGRGPDVAINVDNGLPVNYALRSAVYDISQFPDFSAVKTLGGIKLTVDGETTSRFSDSAMVPYEFNDGYYALPNTQSFLVMFYRKDIFEEKGWAIPETWREVTNLVTELQISNLQFYLPLNTVGATSVVNTIFASMLYQKDGSFYTEDKKSVNLNSEAAMTAFEQWSKYYTDYGFPLTASFVNRFRTGETPIGIAGYDTFNTLVVFAPEIMGKWGFAPLPGTVREDGTIDRRGAASGTAVVMMEQAKDKESSWEFMKWWTSMDTQRSYATELESILGAAARHNTANMQAFQSLSWTREEMAILLSQWKNTVGVPEIAGGYYTGRNLENAFRKVVNNDANPREVLEEYIELMNAEITKKRKEFNLPTA